MSKHKSFAPMHQMRVTNWLAEWERIRPLLVGLVEDRVQQDPRLFYRRRYIELELEHVDQALKGLAVLVNRLSGEEE